MPDNEPPDGIPPDTTPPPKSEDQPAWMTPEGRLRGIPIKDLSAGEEYTEDELHKLRAYWTEARARIVFEWIDQGTPTEAVPEFVPVSPKHVSFYGLRFSPYDLRCIGSLLFEESRSECSPRPDLRFAHLEYAHLGVALLEYADLYAAHLEHAFLAWAQLDHAVLQKAHLKHATLSGAHLKHTDLKEARLVHADLSGVSLEHAKLQQAHLEHANLSAARLEHANLSRASLEHARLQRAHLEHADLECAQIWRTDFRGVFLDDTVFRDVQWTEERRRDPEATMFRGFDVRGTRYSDPIFDQWVKQTNFVWRCRETWWKPWRWLVQRLWMSEADKIEYAQALQIESKPGTRRAKAAAKLYNWPPPLWLLWKVTCDCGRSFLRWALWCLGIAIVFGFIFWLGGVVEVPGPSEAGRQPNVLTYFYFSIVTFTTLGFGDVTPTGNAGEIWVMLEVILGYIGLGGLISIFTTKLIPPR